MSWNESRDLYQKILELPFNRELMKGTLDQNKFVYYMKQADDTRNQMLQAYLKSIRLEWMFWDAAWRMEMWPV